MSSIEEQLARDIAAVTGGVVVSESDLRNAREAVDERIGSRRQRDRRRTWAAAAAVAVAIPVLGVAAFQSLDGEESAPPASPVPPSPTAEEEFLSGSAPTPELLEGVWRVDNDTMLVRFTADGSFQIDSGGRLYGNPAVDGRYVLAGDLITVNVDGGPAGCAGESFAMRASVPEAGALRFVYTKSGRENCTSDPNERWVLEQVLPTSEGLADLIVPAKGTWQPPSDQTWLFGAWMAEGGGYVLEIDPGGSYYVADESGDVVDSGRWALGSPTSQLSLVSGDESPSCAQGDRLVLSGVEQAYTGTTSMRGTLEQNACGGAWAPQMWLWLPNEGS